MEWKKTWCNEIIRVVFSVQTSIQTFHNWQRRNEIWFNEFTQYCRKQRNDFVELKISTSQSKDDQMWKRWTPGRRVFYIYTEYFKIHKYERKMMQVITS